MRRLIRHALAGGWPRDEAIGWLTLDYDARHRRRCRVHLDGVGEALLDLERAVALAEGDGLLADQGDWIGVRAAPEPVLEITTDDPHLRMRVAWHLGNRHVPTELAGDRIRIRPDHVLRSLVESLGATVVDRQLPFQPEAGAYHGRRPHASDHRHPDVVEAHGHAHPHSPPPSPGHAQPHEHDPTHD